MSSATRDVILIEAVGAVVLALAFGTILVAQGAAGDGPAAGAADWLPLAWCH